MAKKYLNFPFYILSCCVKNDKLAVWLKESKLFSTKIFSKFLFVSNLVEMVGKHQLAHGIFQKCLFSSRDRKNQLWTKYTYTNAKNIFIMFYIKLSHKKEIYILWGFRIYTFKSNCIQISMLFLGIKDYHFYSRTINNIYFLWNLFLKIDCQNIKHFIVTKKNIILK